MKYAFQQSNLTCPVCDDYNLAPKADVLFRSQYPPDQEVLVQCECGAIVKVQRKTSYTYLGIVVGIPSFEG